MWISTSADGHIQATGVDAAGRRQYLYHARWRARMDRRKFDRALDLAEALPAARGRVSRALRTRGAAALRARPTVQDADVARALRPLMGRPGEDLLAWREGGTRHDVRSEDINSYVREVTAGEFTAKDFRTWRATAVAAASLAVSGPTVSERRQRRAERLAMEAAADRLGNTPSIARSAYVDPRVVDRYRAGDTIDARQASETAVHDLLREASAG